MFYGIENFTKVLADRGSAEIAAKQANEVIEENSVVLYGRFLDDGTAHGFSSVKEPNDTHVCLGIGMSEMAQFVPEHRYVTRDRPGKSDEMAVLKQQLDMMQAELHQYRNKS